eukprot:6293736-Prymnesium_polylepis.1
MRTLVEKRLGSVAVPAKFVVAPELPETYSGKYMRRLLRLMLEDTPLGDLGALKNPECVEPLLLAVREAISSGAAETEVAGADGLDEKLTREF